MSAEVSLGWNNSKLVAGARGADAIVQNFANRTRSVLNSVGTGIGQGIGQNISSSLVDMAVKAVRYVGDVTVEFDSLKRSLLTVEGTQERVTERLKELKKVAALPGLGMKEAIQGDTKLRSVGLSADLSKRSLIEMGNALTAVGSGKNELDGVLTALVQIVSKGKVSAEEINQIAERVPQVRAVMKEAFGTADTEVIQRLGLSVEQFIEKLVTGFENTVPRATGGMRASIEALSDAWEAATVAFGTPLGEGMAPRLKELAVLIDDASPRLQAIGKDAALAGEAFYEMGKLALAFGGAGIAFLGGNSDVYEEFRTRWKDMHKTVEETDKAFRDLQGKIGSKNEGGASLIDPNAAKYAKESAEMLRQIESERLALGEKQFNVFMSHLPPLLQSEALQKRIQDLQEQTKGQDGPIHELERLKLLEQIHELEQKDSAIRKKIREDEQRKAQEQAEITSQREYNLSMLEAEIAMLDAQNSGLHEKAETMRQNMEIAEDALQIHRDTGLAINDAVNMARELTEARRAGEQSKDKDGKIMGYSQERQGGAEEARARAEERVRRSQERSEEARKRGFGGLDEHYEKQKTRLSDTFKTPGLDAYSRLQDRSRPVGSPMPAADKKQSEPQELPTVEQLLNRLIEATEGLKEN